MSRSVREQKGYAKYLLMVLTITAAVFFTTCDNPVYSKIVERVDEFRESQLTLPPAVPSPPIVDTTDASKLIIAWAAVDGATEYVLYRSEDDSNYSEIHRSSNTSFDDKGTSAGGDLVSGTTYYYKVAAANLNGASDSSTAVSALYDASLPGISVDQGSPLNPFFTNSNTPTITGTTTQNLSPISLVELRIDGSAWAPATTSDGWDTWSSQVSDRGVAADSSVDYLIDVRVTANDGKTNSTYLTLTVDRIVPSISFTNPSTDEVFGGSSTVTITGTASDNSGVDYVVVDVDPGASPATATGTINWSRAVSSLTEQSYTAYATAYDLAGNSTQISRPFSVELTPPSLTFSSHSNGAVITDKTPTIDISATDANEVDSVQIKIGNASWANMSYVSGSTWRYTPGSNVDISTSWDVVIKVRATDDLGNTTASGAEPQITITILDTVPITSISHRSGVGAELGLSSIDLVWTAGKSSGLTYRVVRDGTTVQTSTSATTFSDTTANPRTEYPYQVRAMKSGVLGPLGNTTTGYRHGEFVLSSYLSSSYLTSPTGLSVDGSAILVGNGGSSDGIEWFSGDPPAYYNSIGSDEVDGLDVYGLVVMAALNGSSKQVKTYEYAFTTPATYQLKDTASVPGYPFDVIVGTSNTVYVTDYTNDQIHKYTTTSSLAMTLLSSTSLGTFSNLCGIGEKSGTLYVVEGGTVVLVSSTNWAIQATYTLDAGATFRDVVPLDHNDYFAVAQRYGFVIFDKNSNRVVQNYSKSGTNASLGQFSYGERIAYSSGKLYVTDRSNARVYWFTLE
jgi:hypothetical protein